MVATADDIQLAVKVTGKFENSGDPYIGATGDFDGMGVSCGVLQWNIGSNSLQPLVLLAGQNVVTRTMPKHGTELWSACTSPVSKGLAIVRAWQTDRKIDPEVKTELEAFLGSPEMRAVQFRRISAIAQNADSIATPWAHELGQTQRTTQQFLWYFDILTQNGGMRGIGYSNVESFLTSEGTEGAIGVICNWLEAVPQAWWGQKDCVANAKRWRGTVSPDQMDLFVLSYLRASVAKQPLARGVVMNRKGTLALKTGYVNGALFDFTKDF